MSIRIDKSLFSADELVQYEALIAKAKVDTEAAEDEMEAEKPAFPPKKPTVKAEVEDFEDEEEETQKSISPEMAYALERLESLEKSIAMKEFTEIAKKYAPLGEDEAELAKTLYEMQMTNPDNYDAYVSILDKSLSMVEKSGLFAEIGKSATGSTGGGAVGKIEAAADAIQKSDAAMSRVEAIAKAWEMHPELLAEYDDEYLK